MKKTEFVSSKISPVTKAKLEKIAKRKEWTLSHTINRILEDYQEDIVQNKQSGGQPARREEQHIAQNQKGNEPEEEAN